MIDLAPGEARLVDWTAEEYHADRTCTSRSQLEVLRRDGPQMFAARFIDRTLVEKESAARRLGTLLHMRVLEPDKWAARLAPPKPYISPSPERPPEASGKAKHGTPARTSYEEWKAKQTAWEAEAEAALAEWSASITPDSISLAPSDASRIAGMAAGLAAHPKAREILWEADGGVNEQAIVWRHPETCVLLRVLVDRMVPYESADGKACWFVPDLKTTTDPSPDGFSRSIQRYGYHRQAAIYRDAVQALYPRDHLTFVFVVVRNAPPFEVACYELDDEAVATGRRQYESTLRQLVRRRESNNWMAGWQSDCQMIDMPAWAYEEI